LTKQLRLDIHSEIIIDNFAGGGGASTGIELALGRRVDVAINHDPEAIAMHTANHPETEHHCESVWDIDPRTVKPGRPIGLLWLSPDCKHFSKAKGGKPVEKKIRGLAWVALRWAAIRQPRVIMLENVEEFVTWGPLVEGPDGKMRPCPKRKGREFNAFRNALQRHGYQVEHRELRACDYGAPTIRKRLFLIARRDGLPITWPAQTHGNPMSEAVKAGRLKPWRTAAECIDWTLPTPSIFERTKPLAEATCRRIAKGIMRYVVNVANPFIVGAGGPTYSGKPVSIDRPFGALTAENHRAIVVPVLTEHANASSPRCMPADEPLRTVCAQTKGGHHALVAAFLAKHYTGVTGSDLRDPLGTATSVDHHSLVTSNLIKLRGGGNIGQATDEPIRTISAGGTHFAEVRAFLVKYYGTDQDPRLEEPLHTVTTKDRYGLVTVAGEEYQIEDIGLRMLAPRELFRAQGFPADYIIGDNPAQGLTLTKAAQVRMCGNSVCPPLARSLVSANLTDMAITRRNAA
jgi:DNA (cytosine-5)-methyltransferase 1